MTRKLDLVSDSEANDLAAQLATLREEMAKLAGTVSGLIASKSSGIGARMTEGVERASAQASDFTAQSLDQLNAAGEKAKDASLQLIDAVAAEVRKNPTRTLAITLGLGMILGLMSRSGK